MFLLIDIQPACSIKDGVFVDKYACIGPSKRKALFGVMERKIQPYPVTELHWVRLIDTDVLSINFNYTKGLKSFVLRFLNLDWNLEPYLWQKLH